MVKYCVTLDSLDLILQLSPLCTPAAALSIGCGCRLRVCHVYRILEGVYMHLVTLSLVVETNWERSTPLWVDY